jgi:hypothetical protein
MDVGILTVDCDAGQQQIGRCREHLARSPSENLELCLTQRYRQYGQLIWHTTGGSAFSLQEGFPTGS